jgi:branched-chain amino acid transport system substrate-binding protein
MGTTGALALAGCAVGEDESSSASLTIGILQDFSGVLPEYGKQGTAGFYNGLAQKADADPLSSDALDAGEYEYTVGDTDIELLVRDTQRKPQEAQSLAQDLTTDAEVDLLFGVGNSGGAQRVITQVVDRSDVPFIMGPAASAGLTGSDETCREQVFRANENTAMDARSGGVYIAESTDVDSIALFGADDTFGQSVIDNYRTVLENRGVEIALERSVSSGQQEWQGLLEQAENEGAEGMVGGFTASTLPFFASEFLTGDYDLQLFGGFASRVTLSIVGDTLSDVLGDNFTNEGISSADFGPFTTRYHWNQYDNEINDAFIDRHTSAYGVVPDLFTSGAFTAASAVIQAVEEEGEGSRESLISGLRGMTVEETPKGENGYTFQEYNNQARSAMTVANVEATPSDQNNWPAKIQPGEPVETVAAEDVTIPASEMSCDLS